MHNQNVNDVRRRVREGAAVEVDNEWLFPIAPNDPTAALSLRDLDLALARISEEQRQVILLIGLEGASYGEAASILDVPLGTIQWVTTGYLLSLALALPLSGWLVDRVGVPEQAGARQRDVAFTRAAGQVG